MTARKYADYPVSSHDGRIIRVGTSLGMIIPSRAAKALNLNVGSPIDISIGKENVLEIRKNELTPREGWDELFAVYAKEGKDDLIIPEFLDTEI